MNLFHPTPAPCRLIAIALALCTMPAQASTPCATLMGDQSVAAAVESRLRASSRIQADDIVVVVVSGMTELRGVARSNTQRLLAEQMARDTRGVDQLNNQLDVVDWVPLTDFARNAASRREGADRLRRVRSDTWITTTVENTLALSHGTDNCRIAVRTLDGVVVLQGVMTSPEARSTAVELVAGTYGVRSVDADALLVAGSANVR
ncbi:BON domain-containing protein [Tahibacter caeni]|uniref:BON domain-containing protein n=1 Tax=Tahibacter caeni TaxID=1453545 RepID=UPI0021476D39|nr:BON domain-containing protein [Tahibacter caeni]